MRLPYPSHPAPSPSAAPPGRPGRTQRSALRLLAAALVSLLAVVGLAPLAHAEPDYTFDPSVLAGEGEAVYDSPTAVGIFTVTATGDRTVAVDANSKTGANGAAFTHRLKLGGAGTADYRSVRFTTPGEATLDIYALSSSSSSDRALNLHAVDGDALIEQVPAFGNPGAVIPTESVHLPEAGEYYLTSPSSGVNIYALELRLGEAPERGAWDEVADPVVTDVSLDGENPARLLVTYTGVVGPDGADHATAELLDSAGNAVDSAMNAAHGDGGTFALTPPASGSYDVQVTLARGEDEPKVSAPVAAPAFTLPLTQPTVTSALTSAVTGEDATMTVEWTAVPEAETYSVAYRAAGTTEEHIAADDITGLSADVTGLRAGSDYEFVVTAHRGEDSAASEPFAATAATEVERWLLAHAGVGSGGSVTEHEGGSLIFDTIDHNGKIADSEDGFHYYYTEIDPQTENFTLSATFTVNDASQKDNQSGFGVIAVDTFVPGNAAARYFNSAGTMAAKYVRDVDGTTQTRYGTPGGKFVTGYTEAPTVATPARDMTASQAFDWSYRDGYTEGSNLNPPRMQTGDVYEFTLRRSNTGFHATWDNGEDTPEIIHYDPDLLLQQTADSFYAGVFVTRKIDVTVSDISFTTIHPDDDEEALEPPTTYIDPFLRADVTRTTPHAEIDVPLVANVHGTVEISQDGGSSVAGPVTVVPGEQAWVTLPLEKGTNELTATLTPAADQPQLGEYGELSSYDPLDVSLEFTRASYGEPGQSVWVAPDGTADGHGTPADPLDLHTAVAFAQPGQQVVLAEGVYRPDRAVTIDRGNSGTAEAPITLMSEPGARATLDLTDSTGGGIILRGDHWHIYNLEVSNSQGYAKPMHVQGHHNVVERVESHHNGDTGIQISGSSAEPPQMWPSHNLVLSSVAHNNADPLRNDADGFAAKLTVGEGNVFRYNIAYHNIDDGWDLYAKSTEGPIGAVVVEDSVTYRNGWLEADTELAEVGEGNGFKLGGESMPGAHVLRNSVSYENWAKGVTSNSGPDVRVHDVTAYANGQPGGADGGRMNLQLTTNAPTTDYQATGFISYEGYQADDIVLREQEDTIRSDASNYLDGVNVAGVAVADEWFVSLDTDIRPTIAEDGSIDMGGLLELTDAAPDDAGARLGPNPDPTVIELLPPVDGDDGDGDQCGKPPWAGGPGKPPWAGGQGKPPWAGGPGKPPRAGEDCGPGDGGPGRR